MATKNQWEKTRDERDMLRARLQEVCFCLEWHIKTSGPSGMDSEYLERARAAISATEKQKRGA